MASTQQEQREAAQEISESFVEAYNTGDTSLIEPVVTDDFVCHHHGAGVELHGASEYAGRIKEMRGAFSDFKMAEDILVVEGDLAAAQFSWGGTHDGPFQGIDPTNESVHTSSLCLMRMGDGKLDEMWIYSDTPGMLEQLGLEPRFGED
jgi:steroid delta-isomerase-like uncharacterized protein